MFDRMLDKENPPSEALVIRHIGEKSLRRLERMEDILKERYDLVRELKYPFGDKYGWGYKYSHGKKHLFYLFFEYGALAATIQIGGREVEKLEKKLPGMLPKTRELWANRYPCGSGGWVHYRIADDDELEDVLELVAVRKAPAKQRER